MGRRTVTTLLAAITILTGGCDLQRASSPTSSSDQLEGYLGRWRSADLQQVTDACQDFDWSLAPDGDSLSGTFSANCDGILLTGDGTGQLSGDTLQLSVSGLATTPQGLTCAFQLTGVARLQGNTIRVDYAGSTCIGPLTGTELLQTG